MSKKKFTGKIREDPWVALARGPKEVMASIWQEYLSEVLEAPPKSARFQTIRQEIEKAAEFQNIYQEWNTLSPEDRVASWQRLVGAAREAVQAYRDQCVRCGECCELSSPTLLAPDLALFHQEVLMWDEVYTQRPGELVTSREGTVTVLKEERLKVRQVPGTRQCWFYLAATQTCRIYESRPEQCRRKNCWGDPAPAPDPGELLSRRDLFGEVPGVWDLITAHAERCDYLRLAQALADLAAGKEEAGDHIFEALHFDHYLRQMLLKEWDLKPPAIELLLGRTLNQFFKAHGLNTILTPEGVFRLEPRRD